MSVRRAMVTGASRGIGRATAEAMIARGDRVAVIGRDDAALIELARIDPSRVTAVVGDLTDGSQRDAMVRRAHDALGGLDTAVFAAGVAEHQPFKALQESTLRRTFEVNVIAPTLLARDAAKVMESGVMLFVASTLAHRPAKTTAAYAASKGALLALMRSLALELAPSIRVGAVSPGLVDTAMTRQLRLGPGESSPTGAELRERIDQQLLDMAALHPLGRMGRVEDAASAILHLIDAPWSTGSELTIDGGLSL